MEFLLEELENVKRLCEERIKGSRLIQCFQDLVRVEIVKTKVKTITIVLRFQKQYPDTNILVELLSKTLDKNLLEKLTAVCDEEAKKYLGECQIMRILSFVNKFLEENPLCSCSDEISIIKRQLLMPEDEIKLNQKNSSIQVNVRFKDNSYFFRFKITVPDDYPVTQVLVENLDTNYPQALGKFLQLSSNEMARQCVCPPIRKTFPPGNPFQPKPSLEPIAVFLLENLHRYPGEACHFCKKRCFPEDPGDAIDENNVLHIERIYCGHLYHLKCLIQYIKSPPFTDGKKCLASGCSEEIFHKKYKISPKLAEARWVQRQARERELQDVIDFLK